MIGVTDNEVALVVVQLKFTNWPTPFAPVPAMVGETVKLVSVGPDGGGGGGGVPPPPPPVPPVPLLVDPPPHPTAITIERNAAIVAALRSRNIDATYLCLAT
jgi:hypothetical protein